MSDFKIKYKKITQIIRKGQTFLIVVHEDPDGDAIGSAYGLASILKKKGNTAVIGLNQALPGRYEFLNIDDSIKVTTHDKINVNRFDAIFTLDVSREKRLKNYEDIVLKSPKDRPVINIDHHPDNQNFGQINVVDPTASSTSQIILELFGIRALDYNAAFSLYAGLVYDTGSFRHGNNLKRVHEAAALCLNFDLDSNYIYDNFFSIQSEGSLKLFAKAVNRLNLIEKSQVAYMSITSEDYKELKLDEEASGGFINKVSMVEDASVIIFFNEFEKNEVKISFRSNRGFNVSEFAQKFGGGGHVKASGCFMEGLLEKVMDKVIKSLKIAMGL